MFKCTWFSFNIMAVSKEGCTDYSLCGDTVRRIESDVGFPVADAGIVCDGGFYLVIYKAVPEEYAGLVDECIVVPVSRV